MLWRGTSGLHSPLSGQLRPFHGTRARKSGTTSCPLWSLVGLWIPRSPSYWVIDGVQLIDYNRKHVCCTSLLGALCLCSANEHNGLAILKEAYLWVYEPVRLLYQCTSATSDLPTAPDHTTKLCCMLSRPTHSVDHCTPALLSSRLNRASRRFHWPSVGFGFLWSISIVLIASRCISSLYLFKNFWNEVIDFIFILCYITCMNLLINWSYFFLAFFYL